jgi:hypothetical protein
MPRKGDHHRPLLKLDETVVMAESPMGAGERACMLLQQRWMNMALRRRADATSPMGLGCAKTKSDLVVMPSGRRIFAFFALRMIIGLKTPGAVTPRRVFYTARVIRYRSLRDENRSMSAMPRKRRRAAKMSPVAMGQMQTRLAE